MATQFVKWWKTKFSHHSSGHHSSGCANYRTMSVLGSDTSDGRRSDTEDLIRDDMSSCHNGAHVNAGLAASTSSDNSSECSRDHDHLGHHHDHHDNHPEFLSNDVKFEDFECDVQVEGSESGEERKEFSFTFYDLDGHGKITKDDIAGLVRSIYGAVNDSITVPQGGKKTIKVRLTVTPEEQKKKDEEERTQNETNNNLTPPVDPPLLTNPVPPTTTPSRPKLRNNFNVTIQENLNRYRQGGGSGRRGDRFTHSRGERVRYSSVRLPNNPAQNSQAADCRGCRLSWAPEVVRDCGASPMRHRKKWRESLQRPDLFELIQANMEKNNVSPCCRKNHTQNPPAHSHHHNNRHSYSPSPPLCSHNHLLDPTCPVLPLLNNDNSGCKDAVFTCSPKQKCASPPCEKLSKGQHGQPCNKKHGHHRSRSHDLSHQNSFKYHLFGESRDYFMSTKHQQSGPTTQQHPVQCSNQCSHEESVEILTGCILNQSPRNKNNNNISNTTNNNIINQVGSTPHQMKHRSREQDHARAMTQVINWLERENIGEKNFASPKKIMNPCSNLLQQNRPISASPPVVKKHEHHHVHEHIHHHYYHHHHLSKETPIIV